MRLFAAIVPPQHVLDDLAATVAVVQSLVDDAVRWTTAEQWHLSLAFFGEVDELRRERLEPRLARAASRSPPLDLRLSGAGIFGSRQWPRVVWTGVEGDVTDLRRLAEAVQAAARRSGLTLEERRYRPHLTLARCRGPVDVGPVLEGLSHRAGPVWTADRLQLVRSHLGQGPGRRARYETVDAWPLTGGRPPGD